MGRIKEQATTVTSKVVLELDEGEMRALDALVGYGTDEFLKVFYEHLGKHYLSPHEEDLRSLFELFRKSIPPVLTRINAARKVVAEHERQDSQ